MKKIGSVVICFFCIFAFCTGEPAIKDTSFNSCWLSYVSGTNREIDDEILEMYIRINNYESYKQNREDEFKWSEMLYEIRKEVEEKLEQAKKENDYVIMTRGALNEYDFNNKGFPILLSQYILFQLPLYNGETLIRNQIALYLINDPFNNFLQIDKDNARRLINSRKDSDGDIDRYISLHIYYSILDYNSEEYSLINDDVNADNIYTCVVAAKITKIEAYDNEVFLGELIPGN